MTDVSSQSLSCRCPDCGKQLRQIITPIGTGLTLEPCYSCGGCFVPPGGFEMIFSRIAAGETTEITRALTEELSHPPVAWTPLFARGYCRCPNCSQPMNRKNIGAKSGVMLNVCRNHGVWLAAGGLLRLLDWAASGGFETSRRLEEERLRNESIKQRRSQLDQETEREKGEQVPWLPSFILP
jgi:Zn-finger nucleic acid-binding protein